MSMQYTLQCAPELREPREIELFLCTGCLNELLCEAGVELVDDTVCAR